MKKYLEEFHKLKVFGKQEATDITKDAAEFTTFFKEWNLYGPADILSSMKQGATDYAELY
jgi:hypothetical protein